jgi:hypothetical protein
MRIVSLLAAAALFVPAYAGAFEGAYELQGVDADKSTYKGTVEVMKSGAGYQIRWVMDGTTSFGAGMLDGETLWVGYVDEGRAGITGMKKQANGDLKGPWYRRGGKALGEETWVKK